VGEYEEKRLERFHADLWAHRALGEKGDSPKNNQIARTILLDDLGMSGYGHAEGELRFPSYDLDAETRDRLIAHARQDAAWGAANTASLLKAGAAT